MAFLVYGKYFYGNKKQSSLVEFKQRSGFEPLHYPRYFVPLTLKGRIALRLRLHRGLLGILPEPVITTLITARRKALDYVGSFRAGVSAPQGAGDASSAAGTDSK
jgi:hypothetical protein